jgi:hypothetical protein
MEGENGASEMAWRGSGLEASGAISGRLVGAGIATMDAATYDSGRERLKDCAFVVMFGGAALGVDGLVMVFRDEAMLGV